MGKTTSLLRLGNRWGYAIYSKRIMPQRVILKRRHREEPSLNWLPKSNASFVLGILGDNASSRTDMHKF
jgi:hypothetical protein